VAVSAGVADLNRQASAPGAYEVEIGGDAKRPSSAGQGHAVTRAPNAHGTRCPARTDQHFRVRAALCAGSLREPTERGGRRTAQCPRAFAALPGEDPDACSEER
jgi:hypothetical protein